MGSVYERKAQRDGEGLPYRDFKFGCERYPVSSCFSISVRVI